ncbi:hypothetical protein BDU57DRAFT_502602 [Ampelomyces quisqualis]|uniref:Uncharacterized protein n=1 Tax=Ampelomyces quisqualis TaxID=50730 RepID=A0A6A5QI98_AMPQU|nr:hypothetical protein BDU57DRAFT_502602 [Ampelomyces quisqualis]
MASNAPYYQFCSGQSVTSPRSTNTTPSPFVAGDDDFEPSTADVTAPHTLGTAYLPEHTVRQTPKDIPVSTSDENHNLAELLEAATSAAGRVAEIMDVDDIMAAHDKDSRKRMSSSLIRDGSAVQKDDIAASKRRRLDVPMDPELKSTGHVSRSKSRSTSVPPSNPSLLQDARAAGVHSAAALFRRTSEKPTTRKYTRPPMSKLFMSLQLSPENFLQLQAQAKAYMLDTAHPERQNCVGNRGKGDTDMVKLRLFKCVKDFLDEGSGKQFFGENVEKLGETDAIEAARALGEDRVPESDERLVWPRDGNKIISLVTPLMRRMVTNERQRKYAIETRKGGAKKKDKDDSAEAAAHELPTAASVTPYLRNINIFLVLASRTVSDGTVTPGIKVDEKRIVSDGLNQLTAFSWNDLQSEVIKLLHHAKAKYPDIHNHVVARSGAPANLTETLRELAAAAANAMQAENMHVAAHPSEKKSADTTRLPRYLVKTVGPTGWVYIDDAAQWEKVRAQSSVEVWADGVVNVVVELVDGAVALEDREVHA